MNLSRYNSSKNIHIKKKINITEMECDRNKLIIEFKFYIFKFRIIMTDTNPEFPTV